MLDYIQVLRLHYLKNLSSRQISFSVGCSKTTINDFLKKFRNCKEFSFPLSSGITNELIFQTLYSQKGGSNLIFDYYIEIDCSAIYKALPKKGETLKHLWRKYNSSGIILSKDGKSQHPYSYRQYCKIFNNWCGERNVTCHIQRYPGQNLELDYAGMSLYLTNKLTGEKNTKVTIFVATMSYSDYCYAEGLLCCDISNWIAVNNKAIKALGGITPIITNDNCKVAVIKNKDWIDPVLNKDFQEWAIYNNTVLLPAKVRSPRWKPHVENAVKVITQHILIDMKEMIFFNLDELNQFLWEKLDVLNHGKLTGKDCSRWDIFHNEEEKLLLPLNPNDYQYIERKEVRVYQDFHIRFDKSYYSVPMKYVKEKVEVRASNSNIKVYSLSGTYICEWIRSSHNGSWSTEPTHLPRKYKEYLQWSMPGFQRWASDVGPYTRKVIDKQFQMVNYPVQAFRKCQGILSFSRRYSLKVLEECCKDAILQGKWSYTYIKNTIITFYDNTDTSKIDTEITQPDNPLISNQYKVNDSKYSLKTLLREQEETNVKKH